ncbi:hypothetical protein KW782_02175 [Candidatus Parcubacteria bacterium]|nr:hypothetical protein [Candidatus Parcubacteria bacterium]
MTASPITFVLFGATGDLAQKKIVPALLGLFKAGIMPQGSRIIAFSRRPWTDDDYRHFIAPSLESVRDISEQDKKIFLSTLYYVQGTFDDKAAYERLKSTINNTQVLFHLAIQPEFYEIVFTQLGQLGVVKQDSKILIEKPFGSNIETALQLEKVLQNYFHEDQMYRIDHYLAKDGLWNIIETRKQDEALESRLNARFVQSVEVRLFEKIDIQGRGEFYETIGALRDVGQNHVLEMLAVSAMDLPETIISMPQARADALKNLKPGKLLMRGQYEGYRHEQDVKPESQTETYFKIETEHHNKRWLGVPFIIEGGKALDEKKAEVVISFKNGNEKVFNIDDGKRLVPRSLSGVGDAYEILIEKALEGDKNYFVSIDEIIASWKFIDEVLKNVSTVPLTFYKKGSAL